MTEDEKQLKSDYANISDDLILARFAHIDEPFLIKFTDGDVFEIDTPQTPEYRFSMNCIPWDIKTNTRTNNLYATILFAPLLNSKYGLLHLDFIKEHRKGRYTTLLSECRLNEYLHGIDEQAREQLDTHIAQVAEQAKVTEELKASNPMHWVQMMNNIKSSAEEFVLKEVVYK